MTPQELRQRVVDIVARNGDLERELRSLRATVAAQRRQLQDRPTRGQYDTLAKRCEQLEADNERLKARYLETMRRNGDLRTQLSRINA
jgi:predicted RNase H-like nuclease (RuvC/YqgF family)